MIHSILIQLTFYPFQTCNCKSIVQPKIKTVILYLIGIDSMVSFWYDWINVQKELQNKPRTFEAKRAHLIFANAFKVWWMPFWNQPCLVRESRSIWGQCDKMLVLVNKTRCVGIRFVWDDVTEDTSTVFAIVVFGTTELVLYVVDYDRKGHNLAVWVSHGRTSSISSVLENLFSIQ